jgi:deoxyribonuclease-1
MKGIAAFLLFCCFGVTLAAPPQSLGTAKKLAEQIYQAHPFTFYCGCPIEWKKPDPIDHDSCGYKMPNKKNDERARSKEWEHIVPVSKLRDKANSDFNLRKANLHNLVPAIGQVNAHRNNYSFTIFSEGSDCKKEARNYGACEIKISSECNLVEPPTHTRGAIARIYLYMWEKYKFELAQEQRDMFNDWNEKYPVTEWECERDRLIAVEQGENNPKVQEKCTEAGL